MKEALLVLNIGSSSIKFQLFGNDGNLSLLIDGKIVDIGHVPYMTVRQKGQERSETLSSDCDLSALIREMTSQLKKTCSDYQLVAIGHRIVHGGEKYTQSAIVTDTILSELQSLIPLSPLHQQPGLEAIELLQKSNPELPQIACFDTAFHAQHDALFTSYALPSILTNAGIRRYGFHGLSYEWISRVLKQDHPKLAQGRVVAAHLGSGASICAMKAGKSIDSSMGMTTLDGLPMSTRCGSIDPGAILYMLRELAYSAEQLEDMLYHSSGLKGLAQSGGDIETLLRNTDDDSHFAVDYFALKTAQFIGMMAVSLGGIDALVFTGGIGENSATIRNKILQHLSFLEPFNIIIIPTQEEQMIAIHMQECLQKEKAHG